MASIIYDSYWGDLVRNNIVPTTDTYKMMLTTSAYTESKGSHSRRSHITNEVAGAGYSAGGETVTCTLSSLDTVNHVQVLTFGQVQWTSSTITARKAVIYKSRGGASTADELVGVIDFGQDIVSTSSTFTVPASTLTLTNGA